MGETCVPLGLLMGSGHCRAIIRMQAIEKGRPAQRASVGDAEHVSHLR